MTLPQPRVFYTNTEDKNSLEVVTIPIRITCINVIRLTRWQRFKLFIRNLIRRYRNEY